MSTLSFWKWTLAGQPVPPTHGLKHHVLKQHALEFQLDTLIETGTFLGNMIASTASLFKHIYSIELDEELYNSAKTRFARVPHITLLHGDSAQLLPAVLASISHPCLFWLDAHYSGGITAKGAVETPILSELACILSHRLHNHVVLIDDAREFTGAHDYPTLTAVRDLVAQHRPQSVIRVQHDIIRII
jgi:hypothetical protein